MAPPQFNTTNQSQHNRSSYLGIFLRSQLEVIPSFLVNHTSKSFSTPSKKWVLLSPIMVARVCDIAEHQHECEQQPHASRRNGGSRHCNVCDWTRVQAGLPDGRHHSGKKDGLAVRKLRKGYLPSQKRTSLRL